MPPTPMYSFQLEKKRNRFDARIWKRLENLPINYFLIFRKPNLLHPFSITISQTTVGSISTTLDDGNTYRNIVTYVAPIHIAIAID